MGKSPANKPAPKPKILTKAERIEKKKDVEAQAKKGAGSKHPWEFATVDFDLMWKTGTFRKVSVRTEQAAKNLKDLQDQETQRKANQPRKPQKSPANKPAPKPKILTKAERIE